MKNKLGFGIVFLLGAGALALIILGGPGPGAGGGKEEHGHHDEGEADHHDGEHGASLHLDEKELQQGGIGLDTAKPREMAVRLSLQGKVVPNEERLAHLHPRFPGLIREVRKQLGESVRKGDVLAIVESNESMQPYPVITQINGTVIRKHATVGETASGEEELFTVADLSTVWVDFQAYRQEFPRLRRGQKIRVTAEGGAPVETELAYLAPVSEEHTQTLLVRAVLPNPAGAWPPGIFVKGEVALESFQAGVAVRREALQTLQGRPVLFVREGEAFVARTAGLGRRDGEWVEMLSGIQAGETYAARNSFVLKADLGKGEAEHEH